MRRAEAGQGLGRVDAPSLGGVAVRVPGIRTVGAEHAGHSFGQLRIACRPLSGADGRLDEAEAPQGQHQVSYSTLIGVTFMDGR